MFDGARISEHYGVRRNVAIDIRVRRDKHVVADTYVTDYCSVDSDPYGISDDRCPFPFSSVFLSYCDAFVDIYILAEYRGRIDGYAVGMTDV